jgi:preprotein translocase subunit SecE
MSKVIEFIKETKIELGNVVWPTRAQTVFYSIIVIVLSVLIAYFLGLFDFLFSLGLEKLLSL